MHSSLIGKIQKADFYSQEPERVDVEEFAATFRGDHDTYRVSFHEGRWKCTCEFFVEWDVCSHVIATQRLLGPITPVEAASRQSESQPALI
ncbi:MAG TPA: hypothetical protein VGK54_13540 [Chloroflexota bacterium]